jgi:hypothetical protein
MKVSFSNLLRWGGKKASAVATAARPQDRRDEHRWPIGGAAQMSWTDEEGKWHSTQVFLQNQGDGGMALRSRKPLAVNRPAWLLLENGTDRSGIVQYCHRNPQQPGYEVGLQFVAERRVARKKPAGHSIGTARVKWLDSEGAIASSAALIRNANEGGLQMEVAEPIPAPAIVLLSGHEVRCLAATLNCRQSSNHYVLDAEVVSDTYAHPLSASQ